MRPGWERLLGEAKHDRGVLADGVQHDRLGELGNHLSKDMNGFRLQGLEVREGGHKTHDTKAMSSCPWGLGPLKSGELWRRRPVGKSADLGG